MASSAVLKNTPSTAELEAAFPPIDPGIRPFGSRVLVQIRTAKKVTAGGIILTDDAKDTEKWNTQIAKVIAKGPLAFKNRNTLEDWKEGHWCEPGDFVRVPKYAGDRFGIPFGDKVDGVQRDEAMFVIFDDLNIIGAVTGDPLGIKAFI